MSPYYTCHQQYIVSKISNRQNKDNHQDRPLIRALKSKTPKIVNEVALSYPQATHQSKGNYSCTSSTHPYG